MRRIYDYISKSVRWNEELGILAERSPDEVLTQKTGTGVEINLLLVQMLREAELNANPVLLSTRDNGRLLTIYPIMAQFNHVICEVKIGEETQYLDAKSELRPHNLLPVGNLNGEALVVTERGYRWATLKETAPSIETYQINARMHEDATLTGQLQSSISGYPALKARATLDESKDQDEEGIIKDLWFGYYADIQLDSISIENKSNFERNLTINSEFTIGDAFQSSSDEYYYFNPMLILREDSNPFKLEERKFPVVFPSTFRKKMILSLFVPPGTTIEEVPESKIIQMPNKTGSFRRIVQKSSDVSLSMLYEIRFDKHIFEPEEYEYLKLFWQNLVSTHSELIVLKKGEENEDVKK